MRSDNSLKVGDWIVHPDLDLITRGDQHKTLRPQVMKLLVYLAKQNGQVAHSETILKELWPRKFVTDATLYNCVAELRQHLDDGGDGPGSIQTIPKKGYRLLLPVGDAAEVSRPPSHKPAIIYGSVFAVAAIIVAAFLSGRVDAPVDAEPTPSIVVLPFVALTSDPEDELFADGLTEELIESLSRIGNLKVAGRTSSFFYKGKEQNLRTIGSDLGVENILEGSIRRVDDDLRITTRLITADEGFRLWSENYEQSLNDILNIQRDIADQVAVALMGSVFEEEQDSGKKAGTSSAEAQTKYLIASAHIRRGLTMWIDATQKNEHLKVARRLLDEAVSLDPDFAEAWAKLVPAYYLVAGFGYSDGSGEMLTKAEANALAGIAAARAIELAPQLPEAWVAVGHHKSEFAMFDADPTKVNEAEAAFEKALSIDPDNLSALESYAEFRYTWGQYSEAEQLYDRAAAIDPISTVRLRRAQAMYRAGHVESARHEYFDVARLYPDAPYEGGIAEIEFDRGHFHHGLLWLSDLDGSLPPPYAWASLGDMQRSLESMRHYKEAGGPIAELAILIDRFFQRDYQTLIDDAWAFERLVGSEQMLLLPSLFLTRQWDKAIELAERIDGYGRDISGSTSEQDRRYTPMALGKSATGAAYYGHALAAVGRLEEAERTRRWALEVVERLPKYTPRRIQERHNVRMLIFASRGEKEAALTEFEAMVGAGWRWLMGPGNMDPMVYSIGYGWLEDSPLLDSIRDEPRFITAMKKVKADNAAMLKELNEGLTLNDIVHEHADQNTLVPPATISSSEF